MASQQERTSQNFEDNFDPHEYRQFRMNLIKDEAWQENHYCTFSWLYDFFTNEKVEGDRLLDLASGPLIHNVATASSYFSNIILSDFVTKNCLELQKWLRRDTDRLDWSQFLRIVAKAEKQKDLDKACEEIEERIRSAVKAVVPCNILSEEVIPKEYSKQPFDVIISAFTIENAVVDYDTYCKCLGRINRLLRKGGKLLLMGLTGAKGYEFNDRKFSIISLVEADVQKALEMNGFGDIKWKIRNQPTVAQHIIMCNKLYFITATKL